MLKRGISVLARLKGGKEQTHNNTNKRPQQSFISVCLLYNLTRRPSVHEKMEKIKINHLINITDWATLGERLQVSFWRELFVLLHRLYPARELNHL